MEGKKIVLITGANQGVGFSTSKILAKTGNFFVLLGSRDLQKGQDAIDKIAAEDSSIDPALLGLIQIEIRSDESIKQAATEIYNNYGRLDILVNNAAVKGPQSESNGGASLRELYQAEYNTNVFSHAVMTEEFLPLLRNSAVPRIVFVTSELGSLTWASDRNHKFTACVNPIYRSTKSALNMVMTYYSTILEKEGITVLAVCPGFCCSNLNNFTGTRDLMQGGAAVADAVIQGRMEEMTGKIVNEDGIIPW
ncbi:hypothetical protein FQN57_006164 [Myotisia sp. PD_48]|nr:hypothetical protein FQN57_006164 [Myotisia sp. PD_48]